MAFRASFTDATSGIFVATSCSDADLNGDGDVDSADLAEVLVSWGPYDPCPPFIPTDFDEDCDVDSADLAQVLVAWGPCLP